MLSGIVRVFGVVSFAIIITYGGIITYFFTQPWCERNCKICKPKIIPIGTSLAKTPYIKSWMEENLTGECAICLDDFKESEEVSPLHCNIKHLFHTDCIRQWLLTTPVCPLCKAKFDPKL